MLVDPPAANWPLDKARSDTAQLHPGSTPLIRAFRQFDKLFRSSFFGTRIRIYHGNFAAMAFASHFTRFAPATRLLPTKASLQQNGANGVFTHFWQAIWGFAQRLTQGFQRPGGRAICLRVWFPPGFSQYPVALNRTISNCGTTTMPRLNSVQAFLVEALHQVGDRISGLASRRAGRFCIGSPSDNIQDLLRPSYMDGRLTLRTTNSFKPIRSSSVNVRSSSVFRRVMRPPAFFRRLTHSTADWCAWL